MISSKLLWRLSLFPTHEAINCRSIEIKIIRNKVPIQKLIANEKNIREVTLFPMNQNAQDLMMKAPSDVDDKQLKELNIKKDIKKN